jgi:hypothetical protein
MVIPKFGNYRYRQMNEASMVKLLPCHAQIGETSVGVGKSVRHRQPDYCGLLLQIFLILLLFCDMFRWRHNIQHNDT